MYSLHVNIVYDYFIILNLILWLAFILRITNLFYWTIIQSFINGTKFTISHLKMNDKDIMAGRKQQQTNRV